MADKTTIVIFSGELDKALAAFNIAITSAAMGMEVTLFFTFWGLNIVKKNEGPLLSKGIMRKMLNALNRGGTNRLPLSRFDMFGVGRWMMKRLMRETRMLTVDEMIEMAKQSGVRFVACTTSMGVMGLGKDSFIPAVDEFAGAATYLGEARESRVNLFI